mmetsp:Transcript_8457/g.22263  ORF Transcript_8457/g.22263 Transcript_8457/m.22263 type:complete len:85 (-) Transcript_8457:132-386(-)
MVFDIRRAVQFLICAHCPWVDFTCYLLCSQMSRCANMFGSTLRTFEASQTRLALLYSVVVQASALAEQSPAAVRQGSAAVALPR